MDDSSLHLGFGRTKGPDTTSAKAGKDISVGSQSSLPQIPVDSYKGLSKKIPKALAEDGVPEPILAVPKIVPMTAVALDVQPKEAKVAFDQEQYDLLKKCSDAHDMSEWNKWRQANLNVEIRLQKAQLQKADLSKAELSEANFAHADLSESQLSGADFTHADLTETDFSFVIVDGGTLFKDCTIDRRTNFTGVGLDSARVDPGLKQLLKYNVRKKRWDQWYSWNPRKPWRPVISGLVWLFWALSDYGLSTKRIIVCLGLFAVAFAGTYCQWPECLEVDNTPLKEIAPLHALYFSVVTMTTLGFGELHANSHNSFGQILLIVQAILGHMMFGALLTRFGALFSADGPADPKPPDPNAWWRCLGRWLCRQGKTIGRSMYNLWRQLGQWLRHLDKSMAHGSKPPLPPAI